MLPIILIGSIAVFDTIRPYKWQLRMKFHFLTHKPAFNALGDQLASDTAVEYVYFCPAEAGCKQVGPSDYMPGVDVQKQVEFARVYRPLMEDLGFKGAIIFRKRETGSFYIPSMSWSKYGAYEIYGELKFNTDRTAPRQQCTDFSQNMQGEECEVLLNDRWSITYWWINVPESRLLYEQRQKCEEEGRSNCWQQYH